MGLYRKSQGRTIRAANHRRARLGCACSPVFRRRHALLHHIIWNSTNLDCTRKFRNFWGSTKAIQRLSDTICVEHGLSIIEQPKGKGVHYGKWLGDQKAPSHREQLRAAIDAVLERKPATWEAFVRLLKDSGFEVKAGKQLSVRGENQKRFMRLDTLGDGYSQSELAERSYQARGNARHKKAQFRKSRSVRSTYCWTFKPSSERARALATNAGQRSLT